MERFRRSAKQLVDAIERNVAYVGNARDNVTFAPQDLAAAGRFLADEKDVAKVGLLCCAVVPCWAIGETSVLLPGVWLTAFPGNTAQGGCIYECCTHGSLVIRLFRWPFARQSTSWSRFGITLGFSICAAHSVGSRLKCAAMGSGLFGGPA